MRQKDLMNKPWFSLPLKAGIAATLSLFLLVGCFPGAKAPELVEQYTIEYAPPVKSGGEPYKGSLKVGRFSVAQAYNTTSMVYSPAPYRLATYGYSRWRANPGDMVSDYFVRDLRASGRFLAVFSYRDPEEARFAVEGGVEELLEVDEGSTGKAVLNLSIALIDTKETEITRRLVFQKAYRMAEPMKEQSSAAFVQSMSVAAKNASDLVLKDISDAVQRVGVK
jgi:ABC-type uncharacterized transport system auxiliary subunit